ncbi:MAG: response regulator transcription factor [Magnetospirillum sp. WYHS-4]
MSLLGRSDVTVGLPGPRIVVVEDDPGLREDLVEFLNDRGLATRGVASGPELAAALAESGADLVIVDIELPGESGIEIARRLRGDGDTGILMLTCHGDTRTHLAGLGAGADAYLIKTVDLSIVEATVRAILRRKAGVDEAPASPAGPEASDGRTWIYDPVYWTLRSPRGTSVRLTPKERSLVEILLAHAGEVVARAAVLAAVGYHEDAFGSRALDAMVRRLRRKAEEDAGVELPVQTVHAYGYLFSARVKVK